VVWASLPRSGSLKKEWITCSLRVSVRKPLDGAVAEIGKDVTAVQEVMQRTYLTSIARRMSMPDSVR